MNRKHLRVFIGWMICLCTLLALTGAMAAGSKVSDRSGERSTVARTVAAAGKSSAIARSVDLYPARGANVDLWTWADGNISTKYDMKTGNQVNMVRYTVYGYTFSASVEQGYPWLKVVNRSGFGYFSWTVAKNTDSTKERVGMIRCSDSRGTICTITIHQCGSPMLTSLKADKKNNVTIKFTKAANSTGTAIYYGTNKLNVSDDNYVSYGSDNYGLDDGVKLPTMKKLKLVTASKYVHKKRGVNKEHWYLLRPYKVLGSKKLIGPGIANSLFFNYDVIDITPPGFNTSQEW